MNRRRRYFLRYLLVVIDGLVILGSYRLTYFLRDRMLFIGLEELADYSHYFPYSVFVLFVWLFLLKVFNCFSYLSDRRAVPIKHIYLKLIPVEIIGLSAVAMVLFFLRDTTISRTFLVAFTGVNYISLVLVKQFVFFYFASLKRGKKYHRKALLVGHEREVEKFRSTSEQTPELLFDIIVEPDFISKYEEQPGRSEIKQNFQKVLKYIYTHVVDEVVLAYSDIDINAISPFINECSRMGIMVNVILNFSSVEFQESEIDTFGSLNIITFQTYDFNPAQRFIKRLLDMVLGIVGFLVFCILFIFVAPAIKLSSPGPVFFIQTRKGKNGRDFKLIKFRTMYIDAEERKKELLGSNEMQGFMFKMENDPRITPVGRFLRQTSIDEFPQFVNVVRGDMSLVGTRPPTNEEWKRYETHHRRRMSVQPGITGMWQVSGRNKITDFEEVVKLDTWYIDHWSIWLDFRIIFKTFFILFSGR